MVVGVLYGVGACMLWGFVYLVPLFLSNYDPAIIAAGRFASFGLVALPMIWLERREFAHYTRADWVTVAKLGVIGNIVFYWLLTAGVQNAGAPLSGICMALIPLLVAVIANQRNRNTARAVPWRRVIPGLILILLGLILANWTEFDYIVHEQQTEVGSFWFGVVMVIASLLVWTWYPIRNAEWLIAHRQRSPRAWSTAQGIVTMPFAMLLYLVVWGGAPAGTPFFGPTPVLYITLMAATGIGCSWLGIVLWNAMSQRLPTALGGQMIVFETIFAVIYAHILRGQWPSWELSVGMVLLLSGVLVAIRAFYATTVELEQAPEQTQQSRA